MELFNEEGLRHANDFVRSQPDMAMFSVDYYDGFILLISGSDEDFRRGVEVEFVDVLYLGLATSFDAPMFRMLSPDESAALKPPLGLYTYSITEDLGKGRTYYVCAHMVVVRTGDSCCYPRANLKPDERIASWIPRPHLNGPDSEPPWDDAVVVKRGTYIRDGRAVCDIRILRADTWHGAGRSGSPGAAAGARGPFYYVEYGSLSTRGYYDSLEGGVETLDEAVRFAAGSPIGRTITWDT